MVRASRREQVRRRLRALRAGVGLSQRGIAATTGISESRYWRIENSYDEPTDTERAKLAKALRVNEDALGFGDQVMERSA